MVTYEQVLSKLGLEERKEVDKFIMIVSDDVSKNILRKLASEHSPISFDDLPSKELGSSKVISLNRLDVLEEMKWVTSDLEKKGEYHTRVYSITDEGRDVTQKYRVLL